MADHAWVSEPTPQVPPCFVRIRLALLIELALTAECPGFLSPVIRVHRSLLRSANLPSSSCSPSPCARLSRAPTTTEAPPSVSPISDHRGEPGSVPGRRSEFPCSDFQPSCL